MEEYKRKSWFGRNWIWVVPVSGCLTLIVLVVLGGGALFYGVTNYIKNSTPYEYALTQASEHSEVTTILGEPIETDGMMKGNIQLNNDDGEADFNIPIKGPNGKASIVVIATKSDGEWTYEKLYVLIKATQEEIDLLSKALEGI